MKPTWAVPGLLNIGMTFAILRHFGNVRFSMHLLKAVAILKVVAIESFLKSSL